MGCDLRPGVVGPLTVGNRQATSRGCIGVVWIFYTNNAKGHNLNAMRKVSP